MLRALPVVLALAAALFVPATALSQVAPRAPDGQGLGTQSLATQIMFRAVWGDSAAARWVQEHTTELGQAHVQAPLAAPTPVTIEMTANDRFTPAALSIPRGSTVTWRNLDSDPHTATGDPGKALPGVLVSLPTSAGSWDSGLVAEGNVFAHVFDVPGHYAYICTLHGPAGMVGTIEVT